MLLPHVEVRPEFNGQGIGSELVKGVLDDIRRQGLHAVPLCPFVVDYVARHPEYNDLVIRSSVRAPSTGKPCVRSLRGLARTSRGLPASTTTPASMNAIRSPTSRANPISCVTTTMVMPAVGQAPHDVEHLADQLGVERRGRLVEEHQLRLHRQRPRDRDPLLLAAGELGRVAVGLVGQPDLGELLAADRERFVLLQLLDPDRRLDDILQRGHMREEVEVLKHHADVAPLPRRLARVQLVQLVAALLVTDEHTVDVEATGIDDLEMVDAPQEGRLARAGRADQAHAPDRVARSGSMPLSTCSEP